MVDDITYGLMAMGELATRDGGPYQERVFWDQGVDAWSFMVRGDSDIKTIHDLKPGVKLACPPGKPPKDSAIAGAAWAGLAEEDITWVPFGDMESAVRAVPEGKADAVWWNPTPGISHEAESMPHGIRWMELNPEKDPEGAARTLAIQPVWGFGKPPKTATKSAQGITMIQSVSYYSCIEETDSELTYHLAKWFDENFEVYKDVHPAAVALDIDTFRLALDTTPLPVHEGVIRYLKEKGMWTAADDRRQAYNVDLVTKYCDAYKAAIAEADKRGIKIDPMSEDWMNLWAEYKKDIPIFKVMTEIP